MAEKKLTARKFADETVKEYLEMSDGQVHVVVGIEGNRYLGKIKECSLGVLSFEDGKALRVFGFIRTPSEEESQYLRKVGGKVQTIPLDTIPTSEVIPSIEEEKPIEVVDDKIVVTRIELWNKSRLANYKHASYIDILKCLEEHRSLYKLFEDKEMEFNYILETVGLDDNPEVALVKFEQVLYDFAPPSEGSIKNRSWSPATCYLLKDKQEITITSEEIKEYSEKHKFSRSRGAINFLRDRMEENKKDIAIFYNDKGKLVAFPKVSSIPKVESYSVTI